MAPQSLPTDSAVHFPGMAFVANDGGKAGDNTSGTDPNLVLGTELVFEAVCQISALVDMLRRESATSGSFDLVLSSTLCRLEQLASASISVLGGDANTEIETAHVRRLVLGEGASQEFHRREAGIHFPTPCPRACESTRKTGTAP